MMQRMQRWLLRRPSYLLALAIVLALGIVWGVTALRAQGAKTLDQRTNDVASQLVCPVCNGESVADAPSATAQEMRRVIRQKLAEGDSEDQVIAYFQQHYGDTVLESPPRQGFTALIWLVPLAMLLLGGFVVVSAARGWRTTSPEAAATAGEGEDASALLDDQRARLRAALQRELDAEEGLVPHRGLEGT